MSPIFVRSRIKRWEVLRVPFNAICMIGAWLGWGLSNHVTVAIDESSPARFSDPGALRDLGFGFAVLNIAYCLVYAIEFLVAARATQSWSRGVQIALFCAGCILGFVIAGQGASGIANAIAKEKRSQALIRENIERLKQQNPQAPKPTTLSVPAAAQEPR